MVIQSVIQHLLYYYPNCAINYAYQQTAHPLIHNNPNINNALPVFVDSDFTSTRNTKALEKVVKENHYDLIINFYPFFSNGALNSTGCPILTPFKLVADIVRTNGSETETANVLYQLRNYIDYLIDLLPNNGIPDKKVNSYSGNTIYLSADVISKTQEILQRLSIPFDAKLAFLNPDTSSPYTLIPIKLQVELLRNLLSLNKFDYVLLGPCYTFKDIQQKIYHQIPPSLRTGKLVNLSTIIEIDTLAGIIDHSEMFVTGDTAQMHIAASYKYCSEIKNGFKNKTALVSIFGATDSRIYGYDSFTEHHIAANQHAPSKIFEGNPSCKNLTCIHKT